MRDLLKFGVRSLGANLWRWSLMAFALISAFSLAGHAQMVSPDPMSPLKTKKVMVLEGGSIATDHLAARTATYTNLQGFATTVGFTLVKGDAKNLTDANLKDVDILIFNYFFETQLATALPDASKAAFQRWLLLGNKGYIGYHTSGANQWLTDEWKWYQDNVTSMRYSLHGTGTPQGKVDKTTDAAILASPIMNGLPATFTAQDEWYAYEATSKVLDPTSGCKVMYYLSNAQALDRQPYAPHPVAWFREDAAHTRYFYSTFVHFQDGVNSTWFKSILLRALEYTSGDPVTPILRGEGGSAITMGNLSYLAAGKELMVDLPGKYKISVFSTKGKRLYLTSGEGRSSYAPSALKRAGIYVVKLESATSKISRRLMVY